MRLAAPLVVALCLLTAQAGFATDAAKGQKLYQTCVQCHGDVGQGMESQEAPKIGGQFDWYITTQLKAFIKGERKNPVMLPYIKGLSDQDVQDLAAYISTLAPK